MRADEGASIGKRATGVRAIMGSRRDVRMQERERYVCYTSPCVNGRDTVKRTRMRKK